MAAMAAPAPSRKGARGPIAAATEAAIGPPVAVPPSSTTAKSDMTRPSMRGSADWSTAITEMRTSDQASPTPASPAIAVGTVGATATVTIAPAIIAAARAIARGPGAPRAAPRSVPAKLPAVTAVNAAPISDAPPPKDARTRVGTDTCTLNASVAITASASNGVRRAWVCQT